MEKLTKQTKRGKNMDWKEYKEFLIENILDFQTKNQFTREKLQKLTIRTLERIHDTID